MKNEQILKKAIRQAIKNGYKLPFKQEEIDEKYKEFYLEYDLSISIKSNYSVKADEYSYQAIIFSHDFAKAFFGKYITKKWICCENKKCRDYDGWLSEAEIGIEAFPSTLKDWPYCQKCGSKMEIRKITRESMGWTTHLSNMVLEKDHIKYLEKFLEK